MALIIISIYGAFSTAIISYEDCKRIQNKYNNHLLNEKYNIYASVDCIKLSDLGYE